MPVVNILINAVLERANVDTERLTPLIKSTIIIKIDKTVIATKASAAVIKKALRNLFSFVLFANTIEKQIIEINIKNSTITKIIKSKRMQNKENSPTTTVEINSFNVEKNVGDANIINKETTMLAKPKSISINEVKNFDVIIWFFVTGNVCIK